MHAGMDEHFRHDTHLAYFDATSVDLDLSLGAQVYTYTHIHVYVYTLYTMKLYT